MALDHEQEIFEHSSQTIFWLLTISILAFSGFSAVHPPFHSALPRRRFSKRHFPIRFTSRIQPYITTHTRQNLFIALYIAILALELLQGRRILHTSLCFGEVFFERLLVFEEVELWVYVVFLNAAGVACCFVVIVVLLVLMVLCTLVLATGELMFGTIRTWDNVPAKTSTDLRSNTEKKRISRLECQLESGSIMDELE